MKYVAFVDTLGFTQRLNSITHEEAVEVIRKFNQSVFDLWREMGLDRDRSIKGRTFSDSFIIHSVNNSNQELNKILHFLIRLYKSSIAESDLPLRGGLAVGDFDDIRATEFDNLQKGLVVGTAFVDAYLLESNNGIKGSKLLFGEKINLLIEEEFEEFQTRKVKTSKSGGVIYELKWGDLGYLKENEYSALNKLTELGVKSKWLDHYYGTLETFLIKETENDKEEIYRRIIERIQTRYKYNDLDNFIENYCKSESATHTKKSFLRYIRKRL